MLHTHTALAAHRPDALAALATPLPSAGLRSLRIACARDHQDAEARRKASQSQRSRAHRPRADRLSRSAKLADARRADFAAEVR